MRPRKPPSKKFCVFKTYSARLEKMSGRPIESSQLRKTVNSQTGLYDVVMRRRSFRLGLVRQTSSQTVVSDGLATSLGRYSRRSVGSALRRLLDVTRGGQQRRTRDAF